MRFTPPMRIAAPLLALVFGLAATWLDYRLNLDLDLDRHLAELRERAASSGSRLARASRRLLASGNREALQNRVEATPDVPETEVIGVVDENDVIVADSTGGFRGQSAATTPLAPAAALINSAAQPVIESRDDAERLVSAHPFPIGEKGTGWALMVFDRRQAVVAAQADARKQLAWLASAMTLLSLTLWAVLHFGFATRLGQLAASVEAFGTGKREVSTPPAANDEVGKLSAAFSTMMIKLREREAEQERLEREVLEISESERRRIGHDLHDSLGQRLTAASMATNAFISLLKTDAPSLTERAEEIGRQLREAIVETRLLSHGLAPVPLVEDGLTAALNALAENTTSSGTVRCVFESAESVCVADAEVANHLYRIAQEAVNNALKHANPSEIRISLECKADAIVLEVDDNGEGFDGSALPDVGIGLRVMRYRARLMGGDLETGSPPAGGTRICCRVKMPS
jgi:signal transduction histidine kinase